ncbi:hypothetical protein GCM10027360_67190 [Amycolatopsis echigonensis]
MNVAIYSPPIGDSLREFERGLGGMRGEELPTHHKACLQPGHSVRSLCRPLEASSCHRMGPRARYLPGAESCSVRPAFVPTGVCPQDVPGRQPPVIIRKIKPATKKAA